MRLLIILLLTSLNLTAQGQTTNRPIDYSPDKNFGLLITASGLSDNNVEWKYLLISFENKDTTLLTTAITHDEFRPVTFWSKSSKEIIFEDQTHKNNDNKIKIYNLKDKKVTLETVGFIWGEGKNNFDGELGLIIYCKRQVNSHETFDLMRLNINTKEIKKLDTVNTSGDPITGAPEIETMDKTKRKLSLTFETGDYKQSKKQIDY